MDSSTPRSTAVSRFADEAMYMAEPSLEGGPHVTLLSMTPDPLRVIAAAANMYSGKVTRDTRLITREEAEQQMDSILRTKTQAPLEFVHFHFLLENVTRAFTHQLVRQRTAVYVQESMRFAVKEDAGTAVAVPPSISGLPVDHPWRMSWDKVVGFIAEGYTALVNAGMPAEDARGLLPTNILTRVHYGTSLRGLMEHSGLRLCSQAQFEWKQVWAGIIQAIRDWPREKDMWPEVWQYDAIVKLFKPICYQTGRCEFRGDDDRACRIRDRVEANYAYGLKPEAWDDINPLEPLMEGAARKR